MIINRMTLKTKIGIWDKIVMIIKTIRRLQFV